jgi:hypothetical protein
LKQNLQVISPSPPRALRTHKILTKILTQGFHKGLVAKMSMKGRWGKRVFIRLESSVCLVLRAYVCVLFISGPKVISHVQVLSSGQSKK